MNNGSDVSRKKYPVIFTILLTPSKKKYPKGLVPNTLKCLNEVEPSLTNFPLDVLYNINTIESESQKNKRSVEDVDLSHTLL